MRNQRCSPEHPVAILSFHSHSDRSFLDDRELALLSGTLRDDGIPNDLVVAVITKEMERDDAEGEIEQRLAAALAGYDPIIYERVWSPGVVKRLRRRLPGKVFIGLRGEHEMLDSAPADIFCSGEARQLVPPLLRWLRGEEDLPPWQTLFRREGEEWSEPTEYLKVVPRPLTYAPNLRPIVVNPELLPPARTFSLVGNDGCPYQSDARDNPLFAGTEIPVQYGRGCAFCTTGNQYEGRPNAETAASVLEQLRYLRIHAPELDRLVLKDQNPFGYLTEVIESCAAEGLSGFTLLLETRAEWFLRNAGRFDRALSVARGISVRLAPFLVGIESFSQAELDRFNKGISVATNIEFLDTLWSWKERYGDALDLDHAAFGFILFSPWTTIADLEANLAGIQRTRFDRLRGSILLSRARLYPDTALYYLAKRDGLLVEDFAADSDNASRRYGYYPSHPWKFAHPEVAHFAKLATAIAERNQSRDMVRLFQALLDEFQAAGAGWPAIGVDDVWRRYRAALESANRAGGSALAPATDGFRRRFAALVRPLALDHSFAGGWRFAGIRTSPGRVEVELRRQGEPKLVVELVPRGAGPAALRSRHYDVRVSGSDLSGGQREAVDVLLQAIAANDP